MFLLGGLGPGEVKGGRGAGPVELERRKGGRGGRGGGRSRNRQRYVQAIVVTPP